MYKKYIKRFFDLVISLVALLLIFPVFIIVIVWLYFANKGAGVFFCQKRPGKNEKIFKVFKFKTMTDEKDENGNLLPDKQRLTKVGKFIRATSIDELPQLVNVLKGDMSLIGPRPLLPHHLLLFNDFQRRRMEVKPGITGWAQVHGRNLLKLSKKFEYDVYYVDHLSFVFDLKILMLTVKKVFISEGIGEGAENMKDVDDLGFSEKIKKLKERNLI